MHDLSVLRINSNMEFTSQDKIDDKYYVRKHFSTINDEFSKKIIVNSF